MHLNQPTNLHKTPESGNQSAKSAPNPKSKGTNLCRSMLLDGRWSARETGVPRAGHVIVISRRQSRRPSGNARPPQSVAVWRRGLRFDRRLRSRHKFLSACQRRSVVTLYRVNSGGQWRDGRRRTKFGRHIGGVRIRRHADARQRPVFNGNFHQSRVL